MKRFEFRLERALRLKEQRERLAEMKQREAQVRLMEAQSAEVALESELARAAERLARPTEPADLPWAARQQQASLYGPLLDVAADRVRTADARHREATAERARIAQEVEALRVLRGRQWEAYQREAEKARQEQLDELGLRRWLAARGEVPEGGRS